MKKWFYVDITTTCHELVAVKAEDEEQAKDIAASAVDDGTIDPLTPGVYGSVNDEIAVAECEFKRPPKEMRKLDGHRGVR